MKKESKSYDYITMRQNCNMLREQFEKIGIIFKEGTFENGLWEVDVDGKTLHNIIPVGITYRFDELIGYSRSHIIFIDEDGNEKSEPFNIGFYYKDKEEAKKVLVEMLEGNNEDLESDIEHVKSESFEIFYKYERALDYSNRKSITKSK